MASTKMEVQLNLLWAQYERGLAEAEKATQSRTSRIGQIFNKASRSYAQAITGAVAGLFGANAIDSMMRKLGEELKSLDLSKVRDLSQVLSKIGTTLEETVKQIPLIGGAYMFGEGIATALNLGGLSDSASEARKSAEHLEKMRKLGEAGKAYEEQQKRIEQDRAKAAEAYFQHSSNTTRSLELQLRLLNANNDEEKIAIERQAEFNKLRREALDLMSKSKMPFEEKLEELERLKSQFDEISRRQREIRDAAKRKADEEQRSLEIQEAAERAAEQARRARQEAEREQDRLNRELESAELNRMTELSRMQSASNVVGIGTAVGGVRMAGAVDYSSERMATSLERIRDIETRIEENTRKLKDAQRAA